MKTVSLFHVLSFLALLPLLARADGVLRLGMIGLDTSHCVAFTTILHNAEHREHVPGGRVVATYPGGSDDIEASWSRIDNFTRQMQERFGVEMVDSIEELGQRVDAVLLTSVDGRKHLEQARPVIQAGLPLFIDKPMAASLADVLEIFRLAKAAGVPVFTSSAYRFYPGLIELGQADVGERRGAISYGPAQIQETHPDLFWYAIHPVEALFTVMGTGLESIVRIHTRDTDVVTGVWSGGRVGTFRGIRNARAPNRVILFGQNGVAEQGPGAGYGGLMREVMAFFQTGIPPVSPEETIELFAFMEAADESRRLGGAVIDIGEYLSRHGYERAMENRQN